ncbi:hypothetical protein HDU76_003562 [Blyttiomyces sp. JEL0837]|nr:hypothetical protein HDU76_003562 [Blyttiomyces sp. JEL0837]
MTGDNIHLKHLVELETDTYQTMNLLIEGGMTREAATFLLKKFQDTKNHPFTKLQSKEIQTRLLKIETTDTQGWEVIMNDPTEHPALRAQAIYLHGMTSLQSDYCNLNDLETLYTKFDKIFKAVIDGELQRTGCSVSDLSPISKTLCSLREQFQSAIDKGKLIIKTHRDANPNETFAKVDQSAKKLPPPPPPARPQLYEPLPRPQQQLKPPHPRPQQAIHALPPGPQKQIKTHTPLPQQQAKAQPPRPQQQVNPPPPRPQQQPEYPTPSPEQDPSPTTPPSSQVVTAPSNQPTSNQPSTLTQDRRTNLLNQLANTPSTSTLLATCANCQSSTKPVAPCPKCSCVAYCSDQCRLEHFYECDHGTTCRAYIKQGDIVTSVNLTQGHIDKGLSNGMNFVAVKGLRVNEDGGIQWVLDLIDVVCSKMVLLESKYLMVRIPVEEVGF